MFGYQVEGDNVVGKGAPRIGYRDPSSHKIRNIWQVSNRDGVYLYRFKTIIFFTLQFVPTSPATEQVIIHHPQPHKSNMKLGRPGGRSRPNPNYDYPIVEGRSVPS